MTHREIIAHGRAVLRRAGFGDSRIGEVLPHWVDGFKRGVRSVNKPQKKSKPK